MKRRALEYGIEMKRRGLKGPAPALSLADIEAEADKISLYQVGKRNLRNTFLLERRGYGTLYVRVSYQAYRCAYKAVFKDCLITRDVDHLFPRSKASPKEFIAVGNIDLRINRLQNANEKTADIFCKALNEDKTWIRMLTRTPRARELGMLVLNGYIKPMDELHSDNLKAIGIKEFLVQASL